MGKTSIERTPAAAAHVVRFVDEKGERLLELLGEKSVGGAGWRVHSAGAVIAVTGEFAEHFERLIAVCVAADDAPESFSSLVEERIGRYGRLLEAARVGRVVRTVAQSRSVTAVIMMRRGADPNTPGAELPPAAEIGSMLAEFVRAVDRYVLWSTDRELRYVRALLVHRVPRRGRPPEHILGLDILPMVIGYADEPIPIEPAALSSGVISEIAGQCEGRRDELRSMRSLIRPWRWLRATADARRLDLLVEHLDALAAVAEAERPETLEVLAKELSAIRLPGAPLWRPLAAFAVLTGAALAAYFGLRS